MTGYTYSNGGPIDMSHFRKTGNIRLLREANVSLEKEDLKIKVVGDFTEIDVTYKLKNQGEEQKIQYGFPVDAFETKWHYGDAIPVFTERNDCLQYFEAYESNNQIKVSHWLVDSVYSAPTINIEDETYTDFRESYQIVRKWCAITLNFDTNETKILRIKYKIKNTLRDINPGFKFIGRYSQRNFSYDLNPSSNWGDGVVKDFRIEIDLKELGMEGSKYTLSGFSDLNEENDIFTKSLKNFDLRKSKRINIRYDNTHLKLTSFIEDNIISRKRIKSIKSSSNNSAVDNLIDGSTETTWKGHKGDWIEVEFHKIDLENNQDDKSILGMLVLNGNYADSLKFEESGHMTKVQLLINDTLLFNTEPWLDEAGSKIVELPKSGYRIAKQENIKGLSTIIADGDGFLKNCYKVRMEILESNKNGVILSEIYFVGYKMRGRKRR